MGWDGGLADVTIARGRLAETDPPVFQGGFRACAPDQPDEDESIVPDLGVWEPGRVAGATFGIEYLDARRARSMRRITALKLRYNDGAPLLTCWCHERGAYRSFRLDRIQSCHDRNGEVFETQQFLRVGLGLSHENLLELFEPEDVFGNGMRLLAALARADGAVHPEENERIIQYCGAVYDHHAANFPKHLESALPSLVRSQRPTTAIVDKSLRGLKRASAAERRLFARYAIEVMDADEIQHPAEFAMVHQLRLELEK